MVLVLVAVVDSPSANKLQLHAPFPYPFSFPSRSSFPFLARTTAWQWHKSRALNRRGSHSVKSATIKFFTLYSCVLSQMEGTPHVVVSVVCHCHQSHQQQPQRTYLVDPGCPHLNISLSTFSYCCRSRCCCCCCCCRCCCRIIVKKKIKSEIIFNLYAIYFYVFLSPNLTIVPLLFLFLIQFSSLFLFLSQPEFNSV